MRQLIIDTETTGLEPKAGHRIIELAAVELVNRRPTGRHLHLYFNPEREIDSGATDVHGKTWEDLKQHPRFCDRMAEMIDFLREAEWIIHNAPFDIAFLDWELEKEGGPRCDALHAGVIDTLSLARDSYPGKRNNLDALCERFGVSNAHRTLHGALLDAQLLAEVYLAMTRGQETLIMEIGLPEASISDLDFGEAVPDLLVISATEEELAMHWRQLDDIDKATKGGCLWKRFEVVTIEVMVGGTGIEPF